MKKIMTLAAMFAAVMMGVSSCNPDDTKPQDKPDTEQGGENNGDENNGEEGDEYVCPITIDGDFADWDALTNAVTATCDAENITKAGLKSLKAYADQYFLNVYVEIDHDIISDTTPEIGNVLMLAFSSSTDKGGYNAWSDLCVEYMAYADIYTTTAGEYASWNGALYLWTGELHAEGWSWDTAVEDLMANGAGSGDKYEISIMMDVLGQVMDLDGKILLGAIMQQTWNAAGVLPNAAPTEENANGTAPMLEVPIN